MATWFHSSLTLTALPILGALLGLAVWKRPRLFKAWALAFLAATGLLLTVYAGPSSDNPSAGILMALIVMAAFLSVLGQNQQKDAHGVLFLTLLLVGLGLGYLTSAGTVRISYLGEIFVLVGLALGYYTRQALVRCWGALGVFGLGLTCLAVSAMVSGPLPAMLLLVALAVAFPLFPFHGAFIATLGNLPGSLPAFLVVLLPSLGFFEASVLMDNLPDWFLQGIVVLALLGALYGVLKALVAIRMGDLLAYAYLAQMGMAWWYIAVNGASSPEVVMYFSGLVLVASGLYLVGHQLHTRFGHLDMDKIGGVAQSMPRLATLLVVLVMAAMGLPFFAVFSAFFKMMLQVSTVFPWSVMIILTLWFMLSWLYARLMHQVLFGPPVVPSFFHRDLCIGELAPLVLMVLVLMLAGLVPSDVVEFTNSPVLSFQVEDGGIWQP